MDLARESVAQRLGIGGEPGARLVAPHELLRGESRPSRIAEQVVAGEDDSCIGRETGCRVARELAEAESSGIALGSSPRFRQRQSEPSQVLAARIAVQRGTGGVP